VNSVSVVICAYADARWDPLVEAVEAVQTQTLPPAQIIVSVDHNDALQRRAAAALAGAEVIANEDVRGLSGARNSGLRNASGEIVAFLDDDARPEPTWLEALVRAFDDPAVVGAGGVALPAWVDGDRPQWLPAEMFWVVGCSYVGLPTRTAEIRNPIGATMAFRRDTLRALGGFVDGIGRVGTVPLGCEETELSIRARHATGGKVMHVPDARVQHRVTAARVTWRYFLSRCWAEGLSKALVASRVGSGPALDSERTYATRVLPRGAARGLADALRGDFRGIARAAAIVVGLAVTTAGYSNGTLRGAAGRSWTRLARE
jgi:glycosyltransferase involved in cell wall biosynthesis